MVPTIPGLFQDEKMGYGEFWSVVVLKMKKDGRGIESGAVLMRR